MPRGDFKNTNNPGNIRYNSANPWRGQIGQENDFCVFFEPIYGVRAMYRIITSYGREEHLTTIRQIITRYAPPEENPTQAYINAVAHDSGMSADKPLTNGKELMLVVKYMCNFEQGFQPLPDYIYEDALKLL